MATFFSRCALQFDLILKNLNKTRIFVHLNHINLDDNDQIKMAKSLRSKRKRKVRAEKRIVNAKKELVKLKEVAAKLHGAEKQLTKESIESTIPDVNVTTDTPIQMECDQQEGTKSKRAKTVIDTKWMNQRKIKAIKNKIKKHNVKKARKGHSAGLSSRKAKKRIK